MLAADVSRWSTVAWAGNLVQLIKHDFSANVPQNVPQLMLALNNLPPFFRQSTSRQIYNLPPACETKGTFDFINKQDTDPLSRVSEIVRRLRKNYPQLWIRP